MTSRVLRRFAPWLAVFFLSAGQSALCDETRLAISGYDPVAYFTDQKPVPGRDGIEYVWQSTRWRFASPAHRDLFVHDPERYAPQYDGYCAIGVAGVDFAAPHKDTVDPEVWTIVDGKLYLAHGKSLLWDAWRNNAAESIRHADEHWKFVKSQAEPAPVGPPCREQPPTVIVTTSDGKRDVIVGPQQALDSEGKLVGKGDMAAQIVQVSKNIGDCLRAAGVAKPKILASEIHITDKDEFMKHADLLLRELGLQAQAGGMVVQPQIAGRPDILVEIQAAALVE